MNYKKIIIIFAIVFGLISIPKLCRAMPPGTLLYRTSGEGKMFGYSSDPLINSEKGIIKHINSGHVAIYIGKENGVDYIVEAMAGGIVKNPAKYFVNRADGETFLGARLPTAVSALQLARVVALAKSLVGKNLAYDLDFHTQKGPGDGDWTCVGLTEKIYESANVYNPNNLGALEYDPSYYAIDITPDGFDNESVVNSEGDCFSSSYEFSKIARRSEIYIPAPELIGYNVGLELAGERYIFLPYTQFLQPTLTAVATDIEIYSSFSRPEINGPLNIKALVLRWSLINNPISSFKIVATAIKDVVVDVAIKTKEIAQNIRQKIFGSGSESSLTLINNNLPIETETATGSKKVVVVNKASSVKNGSATTAKSSLKSTAIKTESSKVATVQVNTTKTSVTKTGSSAQIKVSTTPKASSTTLGTSTKTKASTTAIASTKKTVSPAYSNPAVIQVSSTPSHNNGSGSSSGNSSAGANYPQLAIINKIYSTGDNDWVELINTTNQDFDLAATGYRLEKAKTAVDPGLLIRIGDTDDGTYPGGTIIKAHDTYLIVNGGANDYYRQKADALVIREGFSWPGSGQTIFLGTGAISSSQDSDIVDAVGFGTDATYFLGSGPAPEIKDNYILRRASSTDDNLIDFSLTLSDDPSVALNLESNATSTATSTDLSDSDTATSTDLSDSDTATSTSGIATTTDVVDIGSLILIRKIYSTGDNDWIELFNPTDNDFDLMTSNYRLEKAVTSQDPNILMRFGDENDGYYPGGTVIKAQDSYLIMRDDASSYYFNQADAIATRTDFSWGGDGYSIYLGKDSISSSTDPDIIDLVGFGPFAQYYQGSGPAAEILDSYILNRLTNTHNNSTDFNLIASDDPDAIVTEPEVNPDLFVPPVPIISAGLTDIWHFDECYGEAIWTVGKWDCARQFGYYDQPLKTIFDPAVDLNNGFSMSFFYKKSLGEPRVYAIISNAAGDSFTLMTDASMLQVEGLPNSEFRYYQGFPNDYEWHKLTLVINQAEDYWEVYLDSILAIRESFIVRLPVMTDLEIMSDTGAILIDELALWNRSLSALEVASDFERNAPYDPMAEREAQTAAELINFWSFEEDSGRIALDSVGGAIINLAPDAWVGRSHDNYALKTVAGRAHTGNLSNYSVGKDLSMAFWWRDRSYPYNGQADIYLTGGVNNEKNLFALLADNYRLDYWFNNSYRILVEGIDKGIPNGSDWHYLAFVYDSYRYKLSFYVDGEEKASSSLVWIPESEQITGIKIKTEGEEAEIDDLSLWKGALSPSQVKEIYTNNK